MAVTQATQLAEFSSGIGTAGAILEVDNVSNRIGIGTTNPQALLQVGDIIKMDGVTGVITATSFSGNVAGVSTGLTGTPDITVGNIVAAGATFSGVVTYEDVTNVDSLGIVTARTGLEVTANGLVINAGVSTFAADLSIADKIIHTGDTNTAIRFPSGDTFTVETSGTERLRVGSTGTVGVAGLSTATSFGAFNHLSAPFGGGTVSYTVTVASKTANHRYNGSGSSNGYLIDGVEAPFLTLTPGRTYRFVHDNTGSHPLKFYLEADRTTLYSTGVTFDNAYTEIVVSDTTPQVLHYQCTNHAYMGNAVQTNSNIGGGFNVVDESSDTSCNVLFTTDATGTALEAKTGTNLTFNSSTGALTATSFVGAVTGAVTGAATQVTVADESSDTTCFPLFTTGATGDLAPKSGTNLTFNSSSGALTATSFVGAVTGDVTGTASNASGATGDFSIADKIVHTGDTNTAIRFPAADTFTVETGGTERVRIDSSGNFGVGETSPLSLFHVKSGDSGASSVESGSFLTVESNGNSAIQMLSGTSNNNYIYFGDSGDTNIGAIQYSHGANALIFHANASEGLRIDSSGRLLLGTTVAPSSTNTLLRVHCPISSSNADVIQIGQDTDGADKIAAALAIAVQNGGESTNAADLIFKTASGGSSAERLRITSAGNVSIQNDSGKFTVGAGDDLQIYHNAYDSYIDNTAVGDFIIRNLVDDKDVLIKSDNGSGGTTNYIQCDGSSGAVILTHYGTEKFTTTSGGVEITGTLSATGNITQNGAALASTGKSIAMALIFG